jgi:hypothetical protein
MDEFDLDIGPLDKLIDCWCLSLGMLCPSCGLEDTYVRERRFCDQCGTGLLLVETIGLPGRLPQIPFTKATNDPLASMIDINTHR